MADKFRTLKSDTEGYYMDRGSKFLSYARPISSEPEYISWLQQVKKMHPKARHFCSAFRLHPD
ncbi:MAG: YigZ family protein, partial [Bacteroidota bacterium]|nr:YigZ family protein [Bacteroidota bacterium]